jgi:uroporphyrinogen decarboxylase
MRSEQWQLFKNAARHRPVPRVPVALLVGSPWLPGYAGIGHLDYYLDPETWFQTNLKFVREFPDAIPFPSWWIEYGMATEPSAAGSRIHFWPNQPPVQSATLARLEDVDRLTPVNPETDGLMALALHRYRMQKQRIFDAGFTIPVASARGPLCTASFLRGLNELMVDLSEDPAGVHKLLDYTTALTIRWLTAQAEAIGTVEGIFILDDVPGFLSRRSYLEFAHPYLKRICDAFPADWVKVYHNDAKTRPFLADLPDTGFDVLNWSHNLDVLEAREKTGGKLCLMGNVNPLELGTRGTPEEVKTAALEILRKTGGDGVILSMGGGVSAGTPCPNIAAMLAAAREM